MNFESQFTISANPTMLDQYLSKLAETSSKFHTRLNEFEQRLASIEKLLNQEQETQKKSITQEIQEIPISDTFSSQFLRWNIPLGIPFNKGHTLAFKGNTRNFSDSIPILAPCDGLILRRNVESGAILKGKIIIGHMKLI